MELSWGIADFAFFKKLLSLEELHPLALHPFKPLTMGNTENIYMFKFPTEFLNLDLRTDCFGKKAMKLPEVDLNNKNSSI